MKRKLIALVVVMLFAMNMLVAFAAVEHYSDSFMMYDYNDTYRDVGVLRYHQHTTAHNQRYALAVAQVTDYNGYTYIDKASHIAQTVVASDQESIYKNHSHSRSTILP